MTLTAPRLVLSGLLAFTAALAADAPPSRPAAPNPQGVEGAAAPAVQSPAGTGTEASTAPGNPPAPGKAAPKSKGPKAAKSASGSPASVVITVGPNKIRRSQIDTLVDLMMRARQQGGAPTRPGEKEYLEKMIATNLIGQHLLDLEAKRLNVTVEPKTVDSLSQAFRANFPDEATFKKALREAGDSEAGLKEKMIRQIKADKLLNAQVTPVERPTDQEMKDFFAAHKAAFPVNDSLRACQILMLAGKEVPAAEAARKKADLEKIRGELAADTSRFDMLVARFALKARDVSEGPESKDGGDLQRFLPGDFNPEFKKQVTALKVGQMSPVFRTPLGWHLVLLTERNDGRFESYRMAIGRALVAEKTAKAGKNLKQYLHTLADRYKVTYLEAGYRDSGLAGVYGP